MSAPAEMRRPASTVSPLPAAPHSCASAMSSSQLGIIAAASRRVQCSARHLLVQLLVPGRHGCGALLVRWRPGARVPRSRATARALRAVRGNLLPCASAVAQLVNAAYVGVSAEVCRLVAAGANVRVARRKQLALVDLVRPPTLTSRPKLTCAPRARARAARTHALHTRWRCDSRSTPRTAPRRGRANLRHALTDSMRKSLLPISSTHETPPRRGRCRVYPMPAARELQKRLQAVVSARRFQSSRYRGEK
jgi:hypothetical protein